MTDPARLPRLARALLRLSPMPRESHGEVEADLHELFAARRSDRGILHAHWRLYRDVVSLWRQPRPVVRTDAPGSSPALLSGMSGDLRYAARLFARQPAILLLTIVGLSLGLGIATAAFGIVNAALRGEGLVDPDRLPGILRTADRSVSSHWKYDEFLRLREGATRLQVEGVLTDTVPARAGSAEGAGPAVGVAFVSGGFFTATGGRVMLGRALEPADEQHVDRVGTPPVVVSFVFWTSSLNRDPAVLGRTIHIGHTAATIVGVAERGYAVPGSRMLWLPLPAYGSVYGVSSAAKRAPESGIQVFGRLLPGATLVEAEAQLSGVAASLAGGPTTGEPPVGVRLDPGAGLGRMASSDAIAVTVFAFAVIGLVLILSCANVATVLISTAISREREMGVRAALGASRSRIVRQLVTESLALGVIAAAIGLVVASWAIPMIGTMIEAPAGADLAPDVSVFVFLAIVMLVTGLGAGLAPAMHSRGADLVTPLKGEGARPNRAAPRRLRSTLVMTQAAVSVLLIVMASLFVRATFRAAAIDVGFEPDGLYVVSVGPGDAINDGAARISSLWTRAMSELPSVPGIAAISLTELPPFGGLTRTSLRRDGPVEVVTYFNRTGADYFRTMGLRILAGRTFTRDEVAGRVAVALVSESLARAYWHDRSPLGQVLPVEIAIPEIPSSSGRPVIIGVAADAITARLHERSAFAVYEPLDPASEKLAQLVIRVAPGTTGVIQQASQTLQSIDPQADIRIASVAARVQQEASRPRMLATLTGIVGLVAIVLCVIGLYGLTASLVGQRTREMGVRAAIGASPRDLLRLLMRDSLRPVVAGLVIGVGTALLASRMVVAAMLFGVSPQDPVAFAGAAAILLAAATLAVIVPTRRAASVDAALVLRQS